MPAASLKISALLFTVFGLCACAGNDADVSQHGSVWDQAFSQALSENPGKATE